MNLWEILDGYPPYMKSMLLHIQGEKFMKKIVNIIMIAFVVSCLCYSVSFGARFRLKNGDSATGELVSYDGKVFRVKSQFGVISIEKKDMAAIELNTEQGVVDVVFGSPSAEDRDRIRGEIEYVRENEVKIKTDYGYVVIAPPEKLTGIFLSEAEVKKPPKGKPTPEPKPLQVCETSYKFLFQLYACRIVKDTITCSLTVHTTDKDKKSYFKKNTSMFDDWGEEYQATQVQIGTKHSDGFSWRTYIKGVPVQVEFIFKGINPETQSVKVLAIDMDGRGCTLRDIPLSRE